MPRLMNWVLGGAAKDLGAAGREIVTGTPSAVSALGRAVQWTGHAVGNIAAVPLVPLRAATKLVKYAPKTSAAIGVAAAGFTAHDMLKAKPSPAPDFSPALEVNDTALAQTHFAQQQMQLAAAGLAQPEMPMNQLPRPIDSAQLQGMIAQAQLGQGRGASA